MWDSGQQGEEAEIGGDDRDLPVDLGHVGNQVSVGQDDTFGVAGGSGGIDQLGHIIRGGDSGLADRLHIFQQVLQVFQQQRRSPGACARA